MFPLDTMVKEWRFCWELFTLFKFEKGLNLSRGLSESLIQYHARVNKHLCNNLSIECHTCRFGRHVITIKK